MSDLSRISTTFKSVREIVLSIVVLGSIVFGGVMAWQSLQDKPTRAEVTEVQNEVDQNSRILARVLRVQEFQLEQSAWQGEVLDHIAQKRDGLPRERPERLRQLESSLMSTD